MNCFSGHRRCRRIGRAFPATALGGHYLPVAQHCSASPTFSFRYDPRAAEAADQSRGRCRCRRPDPDPDPGELCSPARDCHRSSSYRVFRDCCRDARYRGWCYLRQRSDDAPVGRRGGGRGTRSLPRYPCAVSAESDCRPRRRLAVVGSGYPRRSPAAAAAAAAGGALCRCRPRESSLLDPCRSPSPAFRGQAHCVGPMLYPPLSVAPRGARLPTTTCTRRSGGHRLGATSATSWAAPVPEEAASAGERSEQQQQQRRRVSRG